MTEHRSFFSGIRHQFHHRGLVFHLFLMGVSFLLFIFLIQLSLKMYTKHGNKIVMDSFQNMTVEEAEGLAKKNNFELIVNDSVYLVNMPGGMIVRHSPDSGSIVKRGRKVYLTITKKVAEEINSGLFPDMYGKSYENIKVLMERRYQLQTDVKEYKFDPGPENVILEASYKDQLIVNADQQNKDIRIPKGGAISFVLSQRGKGPIPVPNLTCLQYNAISFVLKSNELKLGTVRTDPSVGTDTTSAWVIAQTPAADSSRTIEIGGSIDVRLSAIKPEECP
ncbi:MAG TPA: PASTA domain-containing protein [Saprospiraceae bacterium]|nr:PASTA domain-containing protein [Saprospiraceae bacterium]